MRTKNSLLAVVAAFAVVVGDVAVEGVYVAIVVDVLMRLLLLLLLLSLMVLLLPFVLL